MGGGIPMDEGAGFGVTHTSVESWLCHFLVMLPLASYLSSLILSVLICKLEIIVPYAES